MKSNRKTISRLSVVFITSFVIAFTTSSTSLADLLHVELEWANLPKGIGVVGQKAANGIQHVGKSYLNGLIHLSNNIAFADNVTKTEIYSVNGKSTPEIALTVDEIRAKKSSFSVLVDSKKSNIKNFIYYSQHDPRWKDYQIGGTDQLDLYGCGPTALSMLVSNLSKTNFTPEKAADWAVQNGYYVKGSGSYHNIIVRGANAFSIDCAPYQNYSATAIQSELEKGNIFVALMRPGVFSRASNHFILLLGIDEKGNVLIAEPNSYERTERTWSVGFLAKELQRGASGGGPLWMVNLAK